MWVVIVFQVITLLLDFVIKKMSQSKQSSFWKKGILLIFLYGVTKILRRYSSRLG